MRTRQETGSEMLTAAVSLVIGVLLVGTGIVNGNARNAILGAAFALQGAIGVFVPRLLPPAPGFSPERLRARRVAAVVLPSGVIYIIAAALIFLLVPERDGLTIGIAAGLFVLGALNVFSGLGARQRAARPDPSPDTAAAPPDADLTEHTAE